MARSRKSSFISIICLNVISLAAAPANSKPRVLIFPDCVCNTSSQDGGKPGDTVSAYFSSYINHLPAGTIIGNVVGSCSRGFPGCETGNYLVNGQFKARIDRWDTDLPGSSYPYKYYGTIQR